MVRGKCCLTFHRKTARLCCQPLYLNYNQLMHITNAMGVKDPGSMTTYISLAREMLGKELQDNSL